MTTRISTRLRNFVAQGGSYARAFQNGVLYVYSGSQPATADAAASGTLLCTVTLASAAHTPEVRAIGSVELTGGAAGSINTLTVDGYPVIDAAVAFDTSLTVTAAALATAINASLSALDVSATSAGPIVTIYAPLGMGALANGLVVASAATTITTTDANMATGTTAVNGLRYGVAASGVVAKLASQAWSGVNAATGTAGWFRLCGAEASSSAADTLFEHMREDGTISTSGGQLNMSSVALTLGATTTVDSWSRTFPAA